MSERWINRALPATAFRNFNFLLASATASSIALWTNLLGNAWVVYKLSDSSAWVSVAVFASMFPFFLAPLGGVVADRLERRYLLTTTRGLAFVFTGALFLVALAGLIEVWIVIAVALLQGIVRSAETPAEQALAANTVDKPALANAVTLATTSRLGSRAVGPILGGPLLAWFGVEGAYALAAVFALLGFLLTFPIATRSRGGIVVGQSVLEGMKIGLRYTRSHPAVFALMFLAFAHCALTMSFDSMLPGFAHDHLHSPDTGFTLLSLGVGVGAFAGSLILAFTGTASRGSIYLATALISGIAPALIAFTSNVPSAITAAMLMGASQAMTMALSGVFLQEIVDDQVRGRIMSLYLMSTGGMMAFANLGYGALADVTGIPVLFLVPGLFFVAIVFGSIALSANLRRVYGTGSALAPASAPSGAS